MSWMSPDGSMLETPRGDFRDGMTVMKLRSLWMLKLREENGMTLSQIGRIFNVSHTAVCKAIAAIPQGVKAKHGKERLVG